MGVIKVFVVFLYFTCFLRGEVLSEAVCASTKDGHLNVHLLAHSHMDLGWLKTVDQYFYGTRGNIQNQAVQNIYDSVLREIELNSDRRFIFVETGFFNLWWSHRSHDDQVRFYDMVKSGRIEFISGGYVMNDEAGVHYSNTIDQMTHGMRILKDIFGDYGIPTIGWQIDPFGHSREYASLLAQMGMDGYFFGRLDYQDKTVRQEHHAMEFIWRGSENLGNSSDIFTGILPNTYSPPSGFCFDAFCDDEVIVDDKDSDEYNVDKRVADFVSYVKEQAQYYATNNLPVTMGNDFNYQDATKWFTNLDSLMKYTNALQVNGSKINVLYSTPSCYLKAVRKAKPSGWPVKTDDFFPYASDPHSYWTGYFTSRPTFKFLDRFTNNWLQAMKQLSAITGCNNVDQLWQLRDALSIGQHHDAVTGTAKQHVNDDYTKRIYSGLVAAQDLLDDLFQNVTGKKTEFVFCNFLNMSACIPSESFQKQLLVSVYNPLAHQVDTNIRIPVVPGNYKVFVENGTQVYSDLVSIPKQVLSLAERQSRATSEVLFQVKLMPLSVSSFVLQKISSVTTNFNKGSNHITGRPNETQNDVVLNGNNVTVFVDGTTGLLKSVKSGGINFQVKQSFYFYKSVCGNNEIFKNRSSGAYIFRPDGTEAIALDDSVSYTVVKGKLYEEVRQVFKPWLSQVIRVYKNTKYVEFNWIVGPIPVRDKIGKEIITRFDTDIESDVFFTTDANGRELLQRKRNYRPTWNLTLFEPVAGNYYPVNSRILIDDRSKQLAILTDRSQGGSSLKSGSVELMVHRRCLCDDAFGVGEPLNEPGVDGKGLVIRGRHWALFEEAWSPTHREFAQSIYMAPIIGFANLPNEEFNDVSLTRMKRLIHEKLSLPDNVHILTLDMWDKKTVLLRLEHFYELKDNAGNNSNPVTISLTDIFSAPIDDVQEMKLAVTHPVSSVDNDSMEVTLTPMQIRTFLVTLKF